MVVMRLENDTITTSKDVFDSFAPLEEGFIKNINTDERSMSIGESSCKIPGKESSEET